MEQTFSLTVRHNAAFTRKQFLTFGLCRERRKQDAVFRKAMSLSRLYISIFPFQAYRNVITCKIDKMAKTECQFERNTVENVSAFMCVKSFALIQQFMTTTK